MSKRGHTQIDSEGTRTRKGMTPGGRRYTAVKDAKGNKQTDVVSSITSWRKKTEAGKEPEKDRTIHRDHFTGPKGGISETYEGAKGPTKVKPGYGKTHTFADGAKIRSGTTPGGRQYSAYKDSTSRKVKVGNMTKETHSGRVVKKKNVSTENEERILKGQTTPKQGYKK